jgi:tetratricopeptide (TPR) repeat protein
MAAWTRSRRVWLVLALAVAAPGAGVVAVRAFEARDLRRGLDEARAMMDTGRPASARRVLADLAARHPDSGEALYRLGLCEQALGHYDRAIAAWERVVPGSPFAATVAPLLGDELINSGRYGKAEAVLTAALPGTGPGRYDLLRALIRLDRFEGRTSDVRRLLHQAIPLSGDPTADLKELWLLDNSTMPLEALGRALEGADRDDDRVWLGQANHALLAGRLDAARERLDACLARRPEDPAVWRSKLDLAVAEGRPAEVAEAARHLPADALGEAEALALRAELLDRVGDASSQVEAWRAVNRADPANPKALERLAALCAARGDSDGAHRWNLAKAGIDRDKDRFRKLLLDGRLESHADELAALGRRLGYDYQARAWGTLARSGVEGWKRAAVALAEAEGKSGGRTLADRYPALAGESGRSAAGSRSAEAATPRATPPRFADEAGSAGLIFAFDHGASPAHLLPETMSGGLAVLDFDGDGWLDVFAVQGGSLDEDPGRPREPDRLFRNRGDGTFEDATEASGVAALPRGYGLGVTAGDIDNDGDPDLFVTRLRSYALLRNRGDGTFEDATEAVGLAGVRHNPTSAALADLDGDGDLDLYVCHYMIYDPAHPVQCKNEKGEFFYCDPSQVEPAPDRLFRNDGGRFVDVTDEAGIVDRDGRGLGVVATDIDEDGRLDLYVANDGTANFLFRNLGGLKFEEVGLTSGVAGAAEGGYQASMGIACGDQDGDGRIDLLVTNFYGEGSTLYHNLGPGLFADWTAPTGLGVATRYLLGFGTSFLDYDDDGRLDLVTANGHVNDNRPYYPYAMPAQLLAGVEEGRLADVSRDAGAPWDVPRLGRGLAVGDMDHDGREDVLILSQGQPLAYLRNRTSGGRSLTLGLEGAGSNRDAVGARVTVEAGGRRLVAERFGGGSYQSAGSPRLHFGLGEAERAEAVEVRWPSGRVDRFEGLAAGGYRLREGEASPAPLPGYGKGANAGESGD